MTTRIDRRQALQGGLATLCCAAWPGALDQGLLRAAENRSARSDPGGILVLIELSGGCDGLSTVIPVEDGDYHRARPTTALTAKETLPLNPLRGLHPSLAALHREYGEGRLAIVEGAGYADPPYSHFRALEIWHTARREGRASGNGWIGRLREHAWGQAEEGDLIVHVGGELPYSMHCADHPAFSFTSPEHLRWVADSGSLDALRGSPAAPGGSAHVLEELRARLAASNQLATRIVEASERHRPPAPYPAKHELANALRTVAAMIHAGFGTRVYSLTMGNFDVHGGRMRSQHSKLCGQLDRALAAFTQDIAGCAAGARTCVLMYSEFGRRVHENDSRGTDHGAAGPMFLLGRPVRGGIHGRHPSVSDLDRDGNLKFTTDFRGVYASVLQGLFGADSRAVLGEDHAALPILA